MKVELVLWRRTKLNSYLCNCFSCGAEFAGNLASRIICPACVSRREQVKIELIGLRPITAAAKRLYQALQDAMNGRKFILATELAEQVLRQIQSDRLEADQRKLRKQAKSERWHSRQVGRRSRDRANARGGKK